MIKSVTDYQKQVATMTTTFKQSTSSSETSNSNKINRRKQTIRTSSDTIQSSDTSSATFVKMIVNLLQKNNVHRRIVILIAFMIALYYHLWNTSASASSPGIPSALSPSQTKTQYHRYIDAVQDLVKSPSKQDTSKNDYGHESSSNIVHNTVGELIEETGFYQSIRLTDEAPLIQIQSQYQLIEVRRSPYYGKVLILDGVIQLTERDADSYNEMMTHIPMFQHHHPKNVLIIGGGDGYVLSEVLKHSSVQHVDHVDLDGDVINVCKQYFSWGKGWDDPRVHLHVADGAMFIADAPNNFYDVIIQDSSDPWTWTSNGQKIVLPSSVLYSKEHFNHIYRSLNTNGVLVFQAESLQIPSDFNGIREWRKVLLKAGFDKVQYGTIMISSYPTGQIGLMLCEKNSITSSRIDDIELRYRKDIVDNGQPTTYYHPLLHTSTFTSIPKWAYQHIYDDNVDTSPTCLAPPIDVRN